jgi:CheY-like chemotaxis protein
MSERIYNILLVEDNPDDIELTVIGLKKNNIANKITVIKDGEEALDYIFKRNNYSGREDEYQLLILLDINLPKVNGLEILKQIKEDPEKKAIPVIILTSSNEEKDLVESYKLGVNSYIRKPVDFNQFVEAIKQFKYYWLLLNELPEM